ncbi:EAL domain-containing protein [Shimia sp.]|uniref:EAL domain-containing protein n=1 Tax=Shimia sp. TaxID=1954381 RepID=UPI003563DB8D
MQRHDANLTGLHEGLDSPLNAAVGLRDADTLRMVTEAIRHGQVLLAFQPVVRARARQEIVFHEALIRVLDATGRVIPAKEFIDAVEGCEAGRQLDCLALELGLGVLASHPSLRLSINMSARSIGYGRWMRSLDAGLRRRPDIAERLILEISESSAVQIPELVVDFMDDLRARGISFALDDFGSGFSSFRHFRDFFFDILKLDGQFSRGIRADPENRVLAGGIAAIARGLDMYTVASRVEHPEDARILTELGFDCLQGFLFGAPTINPEWQAKKKNSDAA